MNKQDIFDFLPYPAKQMAARLWGLYLRSWRYGRETDQLADEALEIEYWTIEKIKEWQDERLAKLLHFSATTVPYYKQLWQDRRRKNDKTSWELLDNWPVLKKKAIKENPKNFLSEKTQSQHFYTEHTSGSTGTPLTLWQSRETLHRWYALFDARVRRWNGFSRNDNWAIIGGQRVIPFSQQTPPFWIWNQTLNQLYLSSYHISPKNVASYLKAIEKFKIRYIVGYPSSLTSFAYEIQNQHLKTPLLDMIIGNAEQLSEYQRSLISRGFGCPVINTYGMSELVCGASECNYGTMHLWPEAGVVEIMDDDKDVLVSPQASGRIIATGLLNRDMPLIRYETGDRGSIKSEGCKCGRHLPILNTIEGRMDDVITTPDGRKIGRLDPIFKTDIPILEAQIIQESLQTLRIKYIPSAEYNHDLLLLNRMKDYLGNMNIILEKVDEIPKGPNGKFKAVISKINK